MSAARVTVQARNVAGAVKVLRDLGDDTGRQVVELVEVEGATPWAVLEVAAEGHGRFAVFPLYPGGFRGDTAKRGQAGVRVSPSGIHSVEHTWQTVLNRARRMSAA